MKQILLAFLIFNLSFQVTCQSIDQIGYYNINGTIAITSIPGYMIISSGDIIDISDPANPVLNSNYSFGYAASIIAEEDYAYFGTEMSCDFYIADISNINFPLHKGFIDFGSDIGQGVFGMAKNDSVLIAAIGASICSIDVTDKSNPVMLDTLFIPDGQSRDVQIKGEYAYVAHYMGMKVIDISDPSDMVLATSIGSGYNSIALSEMQAYVGKSSGGFDAFDISDELNPIPLFSKPNDGGWAWDITYEENHVYLTGNSDLTIYKLENESATEMANYDTQDGGQSFAVCLHESQILLAELITGVAILEYDSLGTVGINNHSKIESNLSLFPNPATDFIIIEQNHPDKRDEILGVEIHNSQGELIDKLTIVESTFKHNVSNYSPGIYFCKIKKGKEDIEMKKFVVY